MKFKSEAVEHLEVFSLFQSLPEFENHMEGWLLRYRSDLSKGEMIALKTLMQFSKSVPGVCHEEIARIL